MTRKFVGSKNFARVIGADLSPTMLEESRRRFEEEELPIPELVRCDSSRLPFATGSIDAIHAGKQLLHKLVTSNCLNDFIMSLCVVHVFAPSSSNRCCHALLAET